jgi:exodeoxyribonuclease III
MKLISFNVNGLRAFMKEWAFRDVFPDADIVCLQEIKMGVGEHSLDIAGYHAVWSTPRHLSRAGYSGVATLVRHGSPYEILEEHCIFGDKLLDDEGRIVKTHHVGGFHLWNVYFPNEGKRPDYRRHFFERIFQEIQGDSKSCNRVIVAGDFNICPASADHCMYARNGSSFYEDDDMRRRLRKVIEEDDWVDTFRRFHPLKTEAYTCWNVKLGTRQSNYGTRIDLILASTAMSVRSADLLTHVHGSDHCPVVAEFDVDVPSEAAIIQRKRRPQQPKLTDFFAPSQSSADLHSVMSDSHPIDDVAGGLEQKVDTLVPNRKRRLKDSSITTFFEIMPPGNKVADSLTGQGSINYDEGASVGKEARSDEETMPPVHDQRDVWSQLGFGRPKDAPLCRGHREPCKLLKVAKKGPNQGRFFYICARSIGSDPVENRCSHFEWLRR